MTNCVPQLLVFVVELLLAEVGVNAEITIFCTHVRNNYFL